MVRRSGAPVPTARLLAALSLLCSMTGSMTGTALAGTSPNTNQLTGEKIPIVVPRAAETEATAVNSSGTVTGTCRVGDQNQAFVWQDGKVTLFQIPGAVFTVPTGIDEKGVIVGHYSRHAGETLRRFGFVRLPDGQIQDVRSPDPRWAANPVVVAGISSKGEMLLVLERDYGTDLYLGRYGSFKLLKTLTPLRGMEIGAVNAAGSYVATGEYRETLGTRTAFIRTRDKKLEYVDLVYPGSPVTIARGLNDRGEVVGRWGSEKHLACFYRDAAGSWFWFDRPNGKYCGANAISNNGLIVGYDLMSDFERTSAWLFRPGPRPAGAPAGEPLTLLRAGAR